MHPTSRPPVEESWSVQRVADILHVSESTVRRRIGEGAFPGVFRFGPKLVRIPVTDLDAYQRRQRLLIAAGERAIDAHLAAAAGQLDAVGPRRATGRRHGDVPLPFSSSPDSPF